MAGLWDFAAARSRTANGRKYLDARTTRGVPRRSATPVAPLAFASHSYPDFHLLMPLYVCRRWDGTVTPTEGQQLAWVKPNRLRDHEMPPGTCRSFHI